MSRAEKMRAFLSNPSGALHHRVITGEWPATAVPKLGLRARHSAIKRADSYAHAYQVDDRTSMHPIEATLREASRRLDE